MSATFCPRQRRIYVLVSAILASSMGFIDGSVVSIAMPAIRDGLPATLSEALWINNAYMLLLSSLILIGGGAGDRFGLRRTFIVGIVVFVAGSVLCAAATDAAFLISARVVQGIGAAIMIPCSLAIIAKAYPAEERGRAIGLWAGASAMTTAAGPILGGLALTLLGDSGWRYVFAINVPMGAAAVAMLVWRVPPDAKGEAAPLDWPGGLLATASLGALAFGLTGTGGEGSVPAISTLVGGMAIALALGLLFVARERRASDPMVPLSLFASRAFSGANILTFNLYFGLSAMLFYLPMVVVGGWGLSEATAAFLFLPISIAVAGLSGPVGRLADRVGPGPLITTGSAVVAVAYGLLAATIGWQDFWIGVMVPIVLAALGMALVVSPLSTAVMTSVTDAQTGVASGINNAVSRMAGLVAVAAMGLLAAWLHPRIAGGAAPAFADVIDDPQTAVRSAHAQATSATFAAIAICASVLSAGSAIVSALTLRTAVSR